MPLYDYDCSACGRRFELVHGVHAEPPDVCPLCGSGPIRKAISAPAIHYKGTGWAKKERRATASSGTSKSTADGGSGDDAPAAASKSDSDSGSAETKPASKKSSTEAATAGSTD
jgi:putative FmdB family regulatory protein